VDWRAEKLKFSIDVSVETLERRGVSRSWDAYTGRQNKDGVKASVGIASRNTQGINAFALSKDHCTPRGRHQVIALEMGYRRTADSRGA